MTPSSSAAATTAWSAAAMLGKSGRKVLLLEAGDALGGAARTEEFFPGFRASTWRIS
jgi:phytoene dehydrogenase-like protein